MAWGTISNANPRLSSEQLQQAEVEESLRACEQKIELLKVTLKKFDKSVENFLKLTPFSHIFQPLTHTNSIKAIEDCSQRGPTTDTIAAQYQVAICEPEAPWQEYFEHKIGEYTQQRKNAQAQLATIENTSFTTIQEVLHRSKVSAELQTSSIKLYDIALEIINNTLIYKKTQRHADKEALPSPQSKAKEEPPAKDKKPNLNKMPMDER